MLNIRTVAQRATPVVRRTIELPLDLEETLLRVVAGSGLSIVEVMRRALRAGLKDWEQEDK